MMEVYQTAYKLVLKVYELSRQFPVNERREMGYQIRRAAISITTNIAEGYGRKESAVEFKHFLRNALGSCNETRVLLDLAHDLAYVGESMYQELKGSYETLSKQLYRLIERWQKQ